jgi:SAM-dependent methyltransferase
MTVQEPLPPVDPFVEAYLRNRPLFFSLIRPQEAALFRSFAPILTHPILDVGAGDGFFARLAFGAGAIDVGLDLEGSRLTEGAASGAYLDTVTFNGRHIPFPDRHFGTVVSNCVLEHVVDLSGLVEEVYRVLQPEGHFLTSVMSNRWESFMLGARLLGDRYRTFMRRRQEHENLLSLGTWESVFTSPGFEIVDAVGYLSARTSACLDAAHYASAPALLARQLTGRWVIAPDLWARLAQPVSSLIDLPVPAQDSAAIFFVLKRPD